ncbi:MAG TPA: hypothetical protein VH083_21940 [Myxococcales bacterium]|nr:hypothetical protein [Myxococcales bacterium]
MKRISAAAALALAAACGGTNPPPPPLASIAMPTGAALKPYDAASPSLARPEGMALVNGTAYVALANYDANFTSAGPGLLAAVVPSTGATTVIDLGGSSGHSCQEPGFVRAAGNFLYAVCGGDFGFPANGQAIVEVNPATAAVTRSVAVETSPAGFAAAATRYWFGDAFGGNVYAIDPATFTVVAGPLPIPCPTTGNFFTTNDVMVLNGNLYAICSNNTGGIISQLDAATGAVKLQADSGPTAVEMTATSDGRIAIVSGADSSIRLVTIGATLTVQTFTTVFSSGTAVLQDVRSLNNFLYTTASGSNTVQKISLTSANGPAVVDEQNTGTSANPWNILPLDDNHAVVSNQGTQTLTGVTWAH